MTLRALRWALRAALAGALAYGALLVWVWVVSRQDDRQPVDAIVVLGAAQYNGRPSAVLKARLDHALELFRSGLSPLIVVTGGIGSGDKESEATVGRRYLLSRDVPATAVVVRPEGRTTAASMASVAEYVRDRGLGSVLLVSDPFHMGRLRLEAKQLALEAHTSPTRSSPISENPQRELRYLAAEALKVPVVWIRFW